MKKILAIIGAIALVVLLAHPKAHTQVAPGNFLGVYTSYLCGSVTAEFPNAPWCFNPQTGQLYSSKGTNSPYRGFNGITQNEFGSSNAAVSTSAANVWPWNGNATAVATTSEGDVSQIVRVAGNVSGLQCALYTAAGVLTVAGGGGYTLALRQNGATSALTCQIAASASSCTDTTHTIAVSVLDQLDFIDTPASSPTGLVAKCSVLYQH